MYAWHSPKKNGIKYTVWYNNNNNNSNNLRACNETTLDDSKLRVSNKCSLSPASGHTGPWSTVVAHRPCTVLIWDLPVVWYPPADAHWLSMTEFFPPRCCRSVSIVFAFFGLVLGVDGFFPPYTDGRVRLYKRTRVLCLRSVRVFYTFAIDDIFTPRPWVFGIQTALLTRNRSSGTVHCKQHCFHLANKGVTRRGDISRFEITANGVVFDPYSFAFAEAGKTLSTNFARGLTALRNVRTRRTRRARVVGRVSFVNKPDEFYSFRFEPVWFRISDVIWTAQGIHLRI